MKRKLLISLALAAALVMGVSATAWATAGSNVGSATLTVKDVQIVQYVARVGGPGTTIDIDCPSGSKVLNGSGVQAYDTSGGGYSAEAGSKLDDDTWEVFFPFVGAYFGYVYTVNATCLEV